MNANIQYSANQKVKVFRNGAVIEATFLEDYKGKAAVLEVDGQRFSRNYSHLAKYNAAPTGVPITQANPVGPVVIAAPSMEEDRPYFNVNTRFTFIDRLVDMVVRGQQNSLIITGSGGLGKSHTVFNRLKLNDLGEADYVKVSGHLTPKALYRALYDNREALLVFDDCDSVLVNDTSVNLLKAALDSYGTRRVCWGSERDMGDLPTEFNFEGRVIFISNFSLQDVPQPVVSRAMYVDVTMTPEEKIDRIKAIAPALCPQLSEEGRNECVDLIDRLKYQVSDLNLRTVLKVASIREANPTMWKDIASYMICAPLSSSRR